MFPSLMIAAIEAIELVGEDTGYIYIYDDGVDTYEYDSQTLTHTKIYDGLLIRVHSSRTGIFHVSGDIVKRIDKTTLVETNGPTANFSSKYLVSPTGYGVVAYGSPAPYVKSYNDNFSTRELGPEGYDPAWCYAVYDPKSKKGILFAPDIQSLGGDTKYLRQLDGALKSSFGNKNYDDDMFIHNNPQYVKIRNVSSIQYRNIETFAVVAESAIPVDPNFTYLESLGMNNIKATGYIWGNEVESFQTATKAGAITYQNDRYFDNLYMKCSNYTTSSGGGGEGGRAMVLFDLSTLPANATQVTLDLDDSTMYWIPSELKAGACNPVNWTASRSGRYSGSYYTTGEVGPRGTKFDITAVYNLWKDGTLANNGIQIQPINTSVIKTNDSGFVGLASPKLTITY